MMNAFSEILTRLENIEYRLSSLESAGKRFGPTEPTPEKTKEDSEKIEKAIREIEGLIAEQKKNPPPVNLNARVLADGTPVPEDASHTEIRPDGQQKGYVVLTAEERGKGFVRPYRDAYRHLTCGKITTMGRAIAETYSRLPSFYTGTFCSSCRGHFPVGENGEFVWYEMDGTTGPKVGT
jgi:hypothetical protein